MSDQATNRYLDLRGELEFLRDEFLGTLDLGWRIQHQLLNTIGHSPPPSPEAWQNFVRANKGRFLQPNEWEDFESFPTGIYCSRFHGFESKDALQEFRTLAQIGFRILEALADEIEDGLTVPGDLRLEIPRASTEPGYKPSLGEFGWLQLLYETAFLWPTGLLKVEPELFWGDPDFHTSDEFEERASEITTPEDGSAPFPTYPLIESIQSDLFRSSAEVISLWLNPEEVLELDEWCGELPVFLPGVETVTTETQPVSMDEPIVVPQWDGKRLYFEGSLIREFVEEAERERAILHAFENDGWSDCVANPLPEPYNSPGHLSDIVYHLNNGLSPESMHFSVYSDRIYWLKGPRPPKRPKSQK